MFKELANLASLVRQAQNIQRQLKELSAELRNRRTRGTAGGGMVEVEINGAMEVLRCKIDPKLLDPPDREMIEDLVATAINQAIVKVQQMRADGLRSITGGMELPIPEEFIKTLLGGDSPDPS